MPGTRYRETNFSLYPNLPRQKIKKNTLVFQGDMSNNTSMVSPGAEWAHERGVNWAGDIRKVSERRQALSCAVWNIQMGMALVTALSPHEIVGLVTADYVPCTLEVLNKHAGNLTNQEGLGLWTSKTPPRSSFLLLNPVSSFLLVVGSNLGPTDPILA